jgi:hypothetical protein
VRLGFSQRLSGFNINLSARGRLRPVFVALVILVLVFSGTTSVYAYSSNQVTRVSILYPVKRGLENIESRFATTPVEKVQFHNKLAERRIAEAQFLSDTAAASTSVTSASTTGDTVPVRLQHENEFNNTLSDADNEIDQANQQAGQISDRTELDQSLALLSDSHLNDLNHLQTMAAQVGLEGDDRTTDNLALVLDNIKNHQQRIVRAISQFNGDLNQAGGGNSTDASSSEASSGGGGHASTTPGEASSSLTRVKGEINNLQTELSQGGRVSTKQIKQLTDRLNKRINQAENAMQAGDLNKFNGLLRATEALTNNGQHFLRENQPTVKPTEIPPAENTGDKIKAQFTPKELLQKQAEQRKKVEEQQRRETDKNFEQNRVNDNATTTINQIATSSINILPEHKVESSSGIPDYKGRNGQTASSSPQKTD